MHMMQNLFKKKNSKTKPLRMSGIQKRFFVSYAVIVFAMMWCTTPVLAAGDPLAVVNNLSDFIFSLIRAIGLILLGFGVVQIGLSLKSHDPSQRANGFLTLAGGVIITFAKEILDLIWCNLISAVQRESRRCAVLPVCKWKQQGGEMLLGK